MSNLRLPSYLLPSAAVRFDHSSGELYLLQPTTHATNDDIARRLSRNTEASSSKLYKWQKHDVKKRKAVVVNRSPMFDAVSVQRARSISDRLSRPTQASKVRQGYGSTDSIEIGRAHV